MQSQSTSSGEPRAYDASAIVHRHSPRVRAFRAQLQKIDSGGALVGALDSLFADGRPLLTHRDFDELEKGATLIVNDGIRSALAERKTKGL